MFHHPLKQNRMLSSSSVQRIFITAGLKELAGLRSAEWWKTAAKLSQETGCKSVGLLEKLLEEVIGGLPGLLREALGTESAGDRPSIWLEYPSFCRSRRAGRRKRGSAGNL